jgi:hypothetical protein
MQMKKLNIGIVMFMAGILACNKPLNSSSGSYTPVCTGNAKSFAKDVSPIIATNCAIYGCHAAGRGPGELITYAEDSLNKASIRYAIVNGIMPKGGSLTTDQKNAIVCWIDAGALNN